MIIVTYKINFYNGKQYYKYKPRQEGEFFYA